MFKARCWSDWPLMKWQLPVANLHCEHTCKNILWTWKKKCTGARMAMTRLIVSTNFYWCWSYTVKVSDPKQCECKKSQCRLNSSKDWKEELVVMLDSSEFFVKSPMYELERVKSFRNNKYGRVDLQIQSRPKGIWHGSNSLWTKRPFVLYMGGLGWFQPWPGSTMYHARLQRRVVQWVR